MTPPKAAGGGGCATGGAGQSSGVVFCVGLLLAAIALRKRSRPR
jgi:hypothetical protein